MKNEINFSYKMKIHHDVSLKPDPKDPNNYLCEFDKTVGQYTGHFHPEFEQRDSSGRVVKRASYGKHPENPGRAIDAKDIQDDYSGRQVHVNRCKDQLQNGNKIFHAEINLSKQQFDSAISRAEEIKRDKSIYFVSIDDCITFTQSVYAAALPGQGVFTQHFTKEQLKQADTLAAASAARRYGTGDDAEFFVKHANPDANYIATQYNVDKEQVSLALPAIHEVGMANTYRIDFQGASSKQDIQGPPMSAEMQARFMSRDYVSEKGGSAGYIEYEVKQGNTLSEIAFSHGTTVKDLLADERNAGFRDNPDIIRPSQKVFIPSRGESPYREADLLPKYNALNDEALYGKALYAGFSGSNYESFAGFQSEIIPAFNIYSHLGYNTGHKFRMDLFEKSFSVTNIASNYNFLQTDFGREFFGIQNRDIASSFMQRFFPEHDMLHENLLMEWRKEEIEKRFFQTELQREVEKGRFLSGRERTEHFDRILEKELARMERAEKMEQHFQNMQNHQMGGWPIIVDMGNGKADLVAYEQSHIFFDMNGNGYKENTAWVSSKDALLAYDFNQDGIINDHREIVLSSWCEEECTDLEALAKFFDSNKDGIFDSKDKEFSKFKLWRDLNQDGKSQLTELTSINESIASFDLRPVGNETVPNFGEMRYFLAKKITSGLPVKSYDVKFSYSAAGIRIDNGEFHIYFDENVNDVISLDRLPKAEITLKHNTIILCSNEQDNVSISGNYSALVKAGRGADVISTGKGNDWVHCLSSCVVNTGEGHDVFVGSPASYNGGAGYDVFIYTGQNKAHHFNLTKMSVEAFYGGNEAEVIDASDSPVGVFISSGDGEDQIIGSAKDDILIGGAGADSVKAGKGNDIVIVDSKSDLLKLDAGEGTDTIILEASHPLEVNMRNINAEIIVANNQSNVVRFGDVGTYISYGYKGANQTIYGGAGNNVYVNKGGYDIVYGGSGNNTYYAPVCDGTLTIHAADITRDTGKDVVIFNGVEPELVFVGIQGVDIRVVVLYPDQSYGKLIISGGIEKNSKKLPVGLVMQNLDKDNDAIKELRIQVVQKILKQIKIDEFHRKADVFVEKFRKLEEVNQKVLEEIREEKRIKREEYEKKMAEYEACERRSFQEMKLASQLDNKEDMINAMDEAHQKLLKCDYPTSSVDVREAVYLPLSEARKLATINKSISSSIVSITNEVIKMVKKGGVFCSLTTSIGQEGLSPLLVFVEDLEKVFHCLQEFKPFDSLHELRATMIILESLSEEGALEKFPKEKDKYIDSAYKLIQFEEFMEYLAEEYTNTIQKQIIEKYYKETNTLYITDILSLIFKDRDCQYKCYRPDINRKELFIKEYGYYEEGECRDDCESYEKLPSLEKVENHISRENLTEGEGFCVAEHIAGKGFVDDLTECLA